MPAGPVAGRQNLRRLGGLLLLLFAVVGILALVLVSPEAMRVFAGRQDWGQLSDIGQAYGGISAVLSALAFCGIAGSLFVQWRQTRIAQVVAARERHFELVKLALERPEFIFAEMGVENSDDRQLAMYFNLWVTHWGMLRQLGLMGEEGVRLSAAELFGNATARAWWGHVGATWATSGTKSERAFAGVVNEEFERVSAAVAQRTARVDGATPDAGASEAVPPIR